MLAVPAPPPFVAPRSSFGVDSTAEACPPLAVSKSLHPRRTGALGLSCFARPPHLRIAPSTRRGNLRAEKPLGAVVPREHRTKASGCAEEACPDDQRDRSASQVQRIRLA